MHLKSIAVHSYKSFDTMDPIELSPGINVIIGENNSGKSALLEAMTLQIPNAPHRSLSTAPTAGSYLRPSEVTYAISTCGAEMLEGIEEQDQFFGFQANPNEQQPTAIPAGLRTNKTEVEVVSVNVEGVIHPQAQLSPGSSHTIQINFSPQRSPSFGGIASIQRDIGRRTIDQYNAMLLRLKSERTTQQLAESTRAENLNDSASNLPAVLQTWFNDDTKAQRLVSKKLKSIFPDIHEVTVTQIEKNQVGVLVWPLSSNLRHLAIPLSECGTGVGQVLAILCALLKQPGTRRVLLIDEPNSYLHPRAIRALMEVIRAHRKDHQFVITTHSPEVLVELEPDKVFRIERLESKSKVAHFDSSSIVEQRALLSDLGVRLAWVFGADEILWVEGETEEDLYPTILHAFGVAIGGGRRILRVGSTGDFHKKHIHRTIDLYRRLCHGEGLVPPALGFLFDRERLSDEKAAQLKEKAALGERLHFLKRPMFENYLLHPAAISAAMVEQGESGVNEQQVGQWLNDKAGPGKTVELLSSERNGASVMKELFRTLSDGRLEYDKRVHGAALVNWLLKNEKDFLRPLALELKDVINSLGELKRP